MPVCHGDRVKVIFSTCSVTFLILSSLNPFLLFSPSSLSFIFPLHSHPLWLHSLLLWLLYVLFLSTKPLSSSPLHSHPLFLLERSFKFCGHSRPPFLVNLTVPHTLPLSVFMVTHNVSSFCTRPFSFPLLSLSFLSFLSFTFLTSTVSFPSVPHLHQRHSSVSSFLLFRPLLWNVAILVYVSLCLSVGHLSCLCSNNYGEKRNIQSQKCTSAFEILSRCGI